MPDHLGPPSFWCDAPPLVVVEACRKIGFRTPLDVRWCRLRNFLRGRSTDPTAPPESPGKAPQPPATCTCREPFPVLDKYAVTFVFQGVADYRLGQCRGCGTIFWEEG